MLKRVFSLLIAFVVSYMAIGQEVFDKTYSITDRVPLTEFISDVEAQTALRFFYLEEWLTNVSVEATAKSSLEDILSNSLQDSGIEFVLYDGYAVILIKNPAKDIQRENNIRQAVKKNKPVDRILFGTVEQYLPGKKLSAAIRVLDENNLAPITGVTVHFNELGLTLITNEKGQGELSLPGGEYSITFNSMNYQEKLVHLSLYKEGIIDVILQDEPNTLEEIVISDQSISNRQIGRSVLNLTDLKRAPALMGQPDLIKQIQQSSGVTTTSEASSGFNVRGGGVDQNLVLFDGTPVFNTAHALGFFNAFNTEVIRSATFYKGGIPAEYGGRASSVVAITSKEGDYDRWKGTAGIGLVTSDVVVGGPIKRDTSSLQLSFRSSYSNWMLDLVKTRYRGISQGSIRFYDGALKYSHKIDQQNKISFSAYTSQDKFSLANDTVNQWRNVAASLKYDRTINENLFASTTLSYGRYAYNVREDDPTTAFNLDYSINYPSLKIDLNHNGTMHKQSLGFQSTYYVFMPGNLAPTSSESIISQQVLLKEKAVESALYLADNIYFNEKLEAEAGLRLSIYNRLGPGTVYKYQPGNALEKRNTIDSTVYGTGEFMKTYTGLEPRLAINYKLDLHSSLKFGYNRIFQYLHLISNSATITPMDIWQASNRYFKPQRSDQISLGYFRTSKNNSLETVIEGYYKYLANVLDFKDGANLVLNRQLETDLLAGKGKAYGIEFSLNKLKGRLKGSVTYTFSRSLRKVNGKYTSEKINEGRWFPSNADQPHVLNVNWNLSITRRIFFTGNFLYHTGRPISLAWSGYNVNGTVVTDFSERNNYRIPEYHRMDIAFVIEGSNKRNRRFEGSWVVSVYNVYGRKNPYAVFFVNLGGGVLKPYQLSLIGTALPSISYNIRF